MWRVFPLTPIISDFCPQTRICACFTKNVHSCTHAHTLTSHGAVLRNLTGRWQRRAHPPLHPRRALRKPTARTPRTPRQEGHRRSPRPHRPTRTPPRPRSRRSPRRRRARRAGWPGPARPRGRPLARARARPPAPSRPPPPSGGRRPRLGRGGGRWPALSRGGEGEGLPVRRGCAEKVGVWMDGWMDAYRTWRLGRERRTQSRKQKTLGDSRASSTSLSLPYLICGRPACAPLPDEDGLPSPAEPAPPLPPEERSPPVGGDDDEGAPRPCPVNASNRPGDTRTPCSGMGASGSGVGVLRAAPIKGSDTRDRQVK